MSSHFLRALLCAEVSAEVLYLPEFDKVSVDKVLKLFEMTLSLEANSWVLDDVELLKAFGVNGNDFESKVKIEIKTENSQEDEHLPNKDPLEVNSDSNSDMFSKRNENFLNFKKYFEDHTGITDPQSWLVNTCQTQTSFKTLTKCDDIDAKLPSPLTKRILESKCPMCCRKFSGVAKRLRDMLKCHIGIVHFHTEIVSQFEEYYAGSSSCLQCGKRFDNLTPGNENGAKKKHLVYNHSNYSRIINDLVNDTMNNFVEKKDSFDLKPDRKEYGNMDIKTDNVENDKPIHKEIKDEDKSDKIFCLKWDRSWSPCPKIRQYIRKHIITHMKDDFVDHVSESFKSNTCLKCNKIFPKESVQRLHLHVTHRVLTSPIIIMLEEILKNGQYNPNADAVQELPNIKEELEETLKRNIQEELMLDIWNEEPELSDHELSSQNDQNYAKMIQMKLLDDDD